MPWPARPRIALLGNPNAGKTTLFNTICGLRARTANFPGTTAEARSGHFSLPSGRAELIDLPGTYRLHLSVPEAETCRRALIDGADPKARGGAGVDALIAIVDAGRLERGLPLVAEALALGRPTVLALNMVDLIPTAHAESLPQRLAELLGCAVVATNARRGEGIDPLLQSVERVLNGSSPVPEARIPPPTDAAQIRPWCDQILAGVLPEIDAEKQVAADHMADRVDRLLTHPLSGSLIFAAIMAGLFWTVFALADHPMTWIEDGFAALGGWVSAVLPAGPVADLIADGVIAGVAGTVVFLPQICLLFFLISLLEDTGYLARAAFVMDRLLSRFGLPGHAFVPLLSSHACALPGIMSTRLIPDPKDRLATILVAPFMSCSARLPVYTLLIGVLFAGRPALGGLAFVACYFLGALAAVVSALLLRRTWLKGKARPMVLELPRYKMPSVKKALYSAGFQGQTFLRKAGTVIVAICIVMWWLSAYPRAEPLPAAQQASQRAEELRAVDPAAADRLLAEADRLQNQAQQNQSFAAHLGRSVQPVFAPLGYDWQLTVSVLTSFLAREVFASTLAVLITGDEDAEGVTAEIRSAVRDDGSALLTPATAASLLIFFVLAMQCLPTLALTRQEAGGRRWAVLQLVYMSGLAWVAAFTVFQGLRWLGVS